ncbi:glycosyltransferase [Thalassomonas sp. RHCl1]|uniref:glycosyltransferase n=1 Tax=Thalassomonas sp. RHCl1 TaxID=2995320 RepID=UPI00248B7586|nr:glycosyltransferase [Thalassomonas sp. RHCl1]
MKILCSSIPALGHYHPMLPTVKALAAAGHEILFAIAPGFHGEINGDGFKAVAAGMDMDDLIAAADEPMPNQEVLRPDQKAARMFSQIAPRAMLKPLMEVAQEWQADVLLHEEGEYAAPLAGHLLGLPNVAVGWPSPMRAAFQLERLENALNEFWLESGVTPPANGGVFKTLYLDPCPPMLQTPFGLSLETAFSIQPAVPEKLEPSAAPAWLSAMPDGPVVHVTFGTVATYNTAPDIYLDIINGLAGKGVNLVITVGENLDPAALGSHGENVHIERYIPHEQLLPHCDAVVCHGGCGSTVSALAHGLPLIVIPRGGAVQMRNAQACERTGAGRMIAPGDVNVDNIRDRILQVLADNSFRETAEKIADEIYQLPPASAAVALIENLVTGQGEQSCG